MTRVTLIKASGFYAGYSVQGHSGFASAGEDIVCAAISCLTITCVNAIEDACGSPPVIRENVKLASLDVMIPASFSDVQRQNAHAMMRFMVIGLTEIAEQYPKHLVLADVNQNAP